MSSLGVTMKWPQILSTDNLLPFLTRVGLIYKLINILVVNLVRF